MPVKEGGVLKRPAHPIVLWLLVSLALAWPAGLAGAAELNGKVIGVSGQQVRLSIDGEYLPQVGDQVTISFQISGRPFLRIDTWKVSKIQPDFVEAEVVTAAGKPAVDQIATISAANPSKRTEVRS